MLPAELVELILDETDIHSLCALYDTNRFWRLNITENDFQRKLQLSCPWFEPQFSHRKTWRECSFEYVRRLKPKSRFAPKLRLLGDEESFSGLFEDPNDEFYNRHDGIHFHYPRVRLLDDISHTSDYGITVDLSDMRQEYLNYINDPEFAPDILGQVSSYPHVVLIFYMARSGGHQDQCHVVVKFRDSPGNKPDVKQHLTVQDLPSVYTMGTHTFLFYISSPYFYTDFTKPAAMYLHKDRFVPVDIGRDDLRHAVVYDGLFSFFGEKRHYCLQANIDASAPTRRSSWIKHLFRCTEAQRDIGWGSRFVMLRRFRRRFLFDVRRGTIQKLDPNTKKFHKLDAKTEKWRIETPKKKLTWREAVLFLIVLGLSIVYWAVMNYVYRLFS